MSQTMNTAGAPTGEITPPSSSRWLAIIAGVAVASVLGYGAALVATGHVPWVEHAASAPVAAVATPEVQSGAVNSGTVDPFEAQLVSPQVQAAVGAESGSAAGSGAVSSGTVDPFEAQFASPQLQSLVGASASSLAMVDHSALDPIETRAASSQAQVASGSVLAHGVLDPFETRAASSATAFPASEPTVGYFDGQWHIATSESPAGGYLDGQRHIESSGYPTPEIR